ncbi:MAG: triose-phosphate isomerase [Alphaproteobacteria bacterium]
MIDPNMKFIVANWKMNGLITDSKTLMQEIVLQANSFPETNRVIICPPATLISNVQKQVKATKILVGGQDCHSEEKGAFTGNVSAVQLRDLGCEYVILGHSERRGYEEESNELVAKKAEAAHNAYLKTIICVGEKLDEKKHSLAVVEKQVEESLPVSADRTNTMIAYEPVWAIGSGEIPTTEEIETVHAHIFETLERLGKSGVPILYGGSVKASNTEEILATPYVSGVLVGGASLKAPDFCAIARTKIEYSY